MQLFNIITLLIAATVVSALPQVVPPPVVTPPVVTPPVPVTPPLPGTGLAGLLGGLLGGLIGTPGSPGGTNPSGTFTQSPFFTNTFNPTFAAISQRRGPVFNPQSLFQNNNRFNRFGRRRGFGGPGFF